MTLSDEYLVARRKVDNSQNTSNLDTTDDDSTKGRKERKRKRNKLGLESSDEEEEDFFRPQSVHPAASLPYSLHPKMANKHLCPQVNALTTRILAPRPIDSLQGVPEETDLTDLRGDRPHNCSSRRRYPCSV